MVSVSGLRPPAKAVGDKETVLVEIRIVLPSAPANPAVRVITPPTFVAVAIPQEATLPVLIAVTMFAATTV